MSECRRVVALLALAVAPAVASAQSLVFTFSRSVYMDAKEAPLRAPEGVACDGGGVVVADTGNARLVRYTIKDDALGGGDEIRAPQVFAPVRVQLDSKGNILLLDRKGSRIVRLDPKGAYLGTVEPKGDVGDVTPVAFRVDADDGVWLLDGADSRVLAVGAGGAVTRSIPLPRGGVLFTDLAIDPGGTVYALEGIGAAVWSAAKGAAAFAPLSKSLKEEMSFPSYLAFSGGKLLVVDQVGGGVVVLGRDGAFLGRQLSQGIGEGMVNYPGQLCVNDAGDVFVANRGDNRLDRFSTGR